MPDMEKSHPSTRERPVAKTNKITLETQGTVSLFGVKGDVSSATDCFIQEVCERKNHQRAEQPLFPFDQDTCVNSGEIAVPVQILAQAEKKNQEIGTASLSGYFKKIFGPQALGE